MVEKKKVVLTKKQGVVAKEKKNVVSRCFPQVL